MSKKHIKTRDELLLGEDECLFELSNYFEEITGLPMAIWASAKGNAKHGPRVKVQKTYKQKMSNDMFNVSVSDNPEIKAGTQGDITNTDLKKVYKWIILNKTNLIKLWNNEYRTFNDFEKEIIKLK